MNAQDQSSIHLYVLQQLRRNLPTKLITYTFPGDSQKLNFPFRDVIEYGHHYVNTINVFRALPSTIEEMTNEFGVPKSKIVFGIAIGCNEFSENVDLEKAALYARYVKDEGLAGVMTWSWNRDTDHRISSTTNECNYWQTGEPDGSFFNAIYNELQN